jgi:hypothetical protein
MSCNSGISKKIISDCNTSGSGGLEVKAWIMNRADAVITYDGTSLNLITNIAMVATKLAYAITGVKKLLNAGHDIVVADDRPNKYTHFFSFQQFEFATEDILNVDAIDDVIVVVESKDKAADGDGVFIAYGVKKGLWKSTDTQRANDINGARNLELMTLGGQEEPFSRYVVLAPETVPADGSGYANTLAMLVALETLPA